MAIADLLEKAKGVMTLGDPVDPDSVEVPDDISQLDTLEPDPKPIRTPKQQQKRAVVTSKATATQKRQIKDNLSIMVGFFAAGLSFRDPVCAGALSAQQDKIIDAMIPIICRNPKMLEWLIGDDALFFQWIALAGALSPVAQTVWAHHVTKQIDDGGEDNGPQDFSAYAAPAF